MADNPINLTLRFLLELAALVGIFYWGWTQYQGVWRFVLAFGLPIIAATVWVVFRVAGDGGEAIIEIPGPERLLLELGLFALMSVLLFDAGQVNPGKLWLVVVAVHFIISYDRVIWLLSGNKHDHPSR